MPHRERTKILRVSPGRRNRKGNNKVVPRGGETSVHPKKKVRFWRGNKNPKATAPGTPSTSASSDAGYPEDEIEQRQTRQDIDNEFFERYNLTVSHHQKISKVVTFEADLHEERQQDDDDEQDQASHTGGDEEYFDDDTAEYTAGDTTIGDTTVQEGDFDIVHELKEVASDLTYFFEALNRDFMGDICGSKEGRPAARQDTASSLPSRPQGTLQ